MCCLFQISALPDKNPWLHTCRENDAQAVVSSNVCTISKSKANSHVILEFENANDTGKNPTHIYIYVLSEYIEVANSTFLVTNKRTKWAELLTYYLWNCFVR